MKNACLASVAFGALALAAGTGFAQETMAPPAAPQVQINALASPTCWATNGNLWTTNNTMGGVVAAGPFGSGVTYTINTGNLVDASNRAVTNFGSGGAIRVHYRLMCNSTVSATLSSTNGRFQHNTVTTLPGGLVRPTNGSATFENYYPYRLEFGFSKRSDTGGPTNSSEMVAPGTGYIGGINSTPPGGGGVNRTATSGSNWFEVRRLDLRIELDPPPNDPTVGLRPVMIAGDYSETFTIGVTPGV
jgi:hypothetical protein